MNSTITFPIITVFPKIKLLTCVPVSSPPAWQRFSKPPEFPKPLLEWLNSAKEPDNNQLLEILARAMVNSEKDVWEMGGDVMPPAVPSLVLKWLEHAPPWPVCRPAREAWLAACVFTLVPDAGGWRMGHKRIQDPWVRHHVSRFLQLADLLDPADKDSLKLLNATMTELNRLPWPDDQSASEDPIAGWIRTVLVGVPDSYVATAEVFTVWLAENPDDDTTLKDFGKRLTLVIRAWGVSNGGKGIVSNFGPVQAFLHRPPIRHQAGEESLELRAMIGVPQMADFVNDHIVVAACRHVNQHVVKSRHHSCLCVFGKRHPVGPRNRA